jgi:hypothetical protein
LENRGSEKILNIKKKSVKYKGKSENQLIKRGKKGNKGTGGDGKF